MMNLILRGILLYTAIFEISELRKLSALIRNRANNLHLAD